MFPLPGLLKLDSGEIAERQTDTFCPIDFIDGLSDARQRLSKIAVPRRGIPLLHRSLALSSGGSSKLSHNERRLEDYSQCETNTRQLISAVREGCEGNGPDTVGLEDVPIRRGQRRFGVLDHPIVPQPYALMREQGPCQPSGVQVSGMAHMAHASGTEDHGRRCGQSVRGVGIDVQGCTPNPGLGRGRSRGQGVMPGRVFRRKGSAFPLSVAREQTLH